MDEKNKHMQSEEFVLLQSSSPPLLILTQSELKHQQQHRFIKMKKKNIKRSWKNNRKCSDPIVRCLYYVIFHISALSFAFFFILLLVFYFYFFPFACARMHHSIVFLEAFHCFCFALL